MLALLCDSWQNGSPFLLSGDVFCLYLGPVFFCTLSIILQDTPILTSLWQATSSKDNDAVDRRGSSGSQWPDFDVALTMAGS